MTISRGFVLTVLLLSSTAPAWAQAPQSLMTARVVYMTRRAMARPDGALKATLDEIDRDLTRAMRLGRTAEARRLLAKGTTLLTGGQWTGEAEFQHSLVLRSDAIYADTSKPLVVRLEQIYAPSIELTRSLTARLTLRKRTAAPAAPAVSRAPARQPAETIVRELGTSEGVGRDLRDTPHVMALQVAGVEDGSYLVHAEVADGDHRLGSTMLAVRLHKGLDGRLERLAAAAGEVPEAFRSEILYPVDHVRQVNLARISPGSVDLAAALSQAEAALPAARAGRDPLAGRTGDLTRHHRLAGGDEIMPYRVHVPRGYDGTRAFPLVVALHGLGANEGTFFESYGGRLPALAEQHGYLVASPLGYRVDGFYGWGVGAPPEDAATRVVQERSEQDVLAVLAEMQRLYRVDDQRIYLMGHSMGAIGTWRLAAKYPDIWAAIAPMSGSGGPATVERMKGIPQIVVHGDADPTVPVAGSRVMVAAMKRLGVEVEYIEVPGGNHLDVVAPNLERVIAFFGAHRKGPAKQ